MNVFISLVAFLAFSIPLLGQGAFSGKNLGGNAILGEDGLPISKLSGRVELLDGNRVLASGSFIKDGYFALGVIADTSAGTSASITVRAWDSTVGATFESALATGHGYGQSTITVKLATGAESPVDLAASGFKGFRLIESGLSGYSSGNKRVRIQRLPYFPAGTITTNQTTWIVTHGWNSSRTNQNIDDLARTLLQVRPTDQILTLDWSQGADTGIVGDLAAAAEIIPTAAWAASALQKAGLRGTDINLVGHSFGAYVSDEIAKRIPGGVNAIVALDPAADCCSGVFDPVTNREIDFGRDSKFSWAFHASSAGNEFTPVTADEAFIADTGVDTITAHSNVVELLAWLWVHPNDPLGKLFTIDRLLENNYGPWQLDKYTAFFALDKPAPGYEAIISESSMAKSPTDPSARFTTTYIPQEYLPSMYIVRDGTNITLGFNNGGWGTFRLQTSPDLKTWTTSTNLISLSYYGRSNTFTISTNIPGAFYWRLLHSH